MVLARFQRTIVDALGNVLPGATITVRKEIAGAPLAVLYTDRAGTVPLGNPFAADGDGFAAFHTAGGALRITAASGATSIDWRYVPIGLAGEADGIVNGTQMLFAAATADADPGAGYFRFNNAILASVTTIYIDNAAANTADISTWLDSFDDGGSSGNRGTIVITQVGGDAFFMGRVTGSVVNGTGYRKITVTPLATVGTFAADRAAGVVFNGKGVDGTGDVTGPAAGVVNGEFALYNSTTGKIIKGSGGTIAASAADVRAAVAQRIFTTDLIEGASNFVTVTDAASITWSWDGIINGIVTLAGDRTLAMPSDAQPGTWRTFWVQSDSGTLRQLSFGANFLGNVTPVTGINNSTTRRLISIIALSATVGFFCQLTGGF